MKKAFLRDSSIGVFLWTLKNFKEYLLYRTHPGDGSRNLPSPWKPPSPGPNPKSYLDPNLWRWIFFQGRFLLTTLQPGRLLLQIGFDFEVSQFFQLKVADSECINHIARALLRELKKVDNNWGILSQALHNGLSKLHTICSSIDLAIQFVKNRQKLKNFSLLKSLHIGDKIFQGSISLQKLSKMDSMNLIALVVPVLLHWNMLNLL